MHILGEIQRTETSNLENTSRREGNQGKTRNRRREAVIQTAERQPHRGILPGEARQAKLERRVPPQDARFRPETRELDPDRAAR